MMLARAFRIGLPYVGFINSLPAAFEDGAAIGKALSPSQRVARKPLRNFLSKPPGTCLDRFRADCAFLNSVSWGKGQSVDE